MDKRTKKECQSMVKRALSMPEPAQTIALREVFDKAVAPAIITTVSKTFRPAMFEKHVVLLVEEHREELTKLAEVDVVPLVDREVNRVFKHRQIQVRYAGNFVHESGGRLRPFGNPDTDERMERTQEFLRQELLHGERHSVLASRFPDYADFLSHLVGELRRQGIKIAK